MMGNKKEFEAVVLSHKMDKTAVVQIKRLVKDRQFHKYRLTTKKFKVHDEKNESHSGDTVMIRECHPISKEKRWAIVQVISKSAE